MGCGRQGCRSEARGSPTSHMNLRGGSIVLLLTWPHASEAHVRRTLRNSLAISPWPYEIRRAVFNWINDAECCRYPDLPVHDCLKKVRPIGDNKPVEKLLSEVP